MITYRVYFRNAGSIAGRQDFTANDDGEAGATADVLCRACSDRCDAVEVWDGIRCVVPPHAPRSRLAELTERRQQAMIDLEDTIQRSAFAVAGSERLLKQGAELRARLRPLAG